MTQTAERTALQELARRHPHAAGEIGRALDALDAGDVDAAAYALYGAWFIVSHEGDKVLEPVIRRLNPDGPQGASDMFARMRARLGGDR